MQPKTASIAGHSATAVVVLAIGLVLSAAASYWAANQLERDARAKFEIAVANAEDGIERRIQAYADVLHGVRGLFSASQSVSRDAFRHYVSSLNLEQRYFGFQAVTFNRRVPSERKRDYEAAVRHDTSLDPNGYPNFTIRPPGDRPEYFVVEYLEPMWNVYFTARQRFGSPTDRWLPLGVLFGGITITLLLFGLIRSLATVGSRAVMLAESITEDLRQSQASLAETQRMTQELIKALPNPIYFKGTDGRYLGVNKAWETYFGVPRQAFLGKTVHDLYPDNPEIAQRLHADDQALWNRPGSRSYETSITTPDGQRHDAIYYKATFTHTNGSVAGLIGTIVDISERKQAEAARAQLAAIVENSSDAIISRSLDRKILSWNAAAERLFGYTAAEIIGQSVSLIIPPEREQESVRNRVLLAQGLAVLDLETERLAKGGGASPCR